LRPEEIELLVCGSTGSFNINDLIAVTEYDGYTESDDVIKWFWEIITKDFDYQQHKRFLLFTTASDRIPIGGIHEMTLKISRIDSNDQ
jgi:E3 ubiquitin-protein ligase HECTD2